MIRKRNNSFYMLSASRITEDDKIDTQMNILEESIEQVGSTGFSKTHE